MSNKKTKKVAKGFTLIEMLVVIVVIGILSTIVLVSVSSGRRKAQATKAKTDVTELSKAFEMAASEGCTKLGFTSDGELKCSSTGNSNVYVTLKSAPNGITYTLILEKGTATLTGTTWAGTNGTSDSSINKGYNFTASGFTSGNFPCNDGTLGGATRSGCYCTVPDACGDIQ